MTSPRTLRDITDLAPGDHLCCLYETEEEHRAVLTPFLRQGLERGEKVLYIVDAHQTESLFAYLREDGLEVEPYLARGQLCILTSADTYLGQGVFDPDAMVALLRSETARALA
jgi:KaiC/GvpD/RAD55 family RecA-like ATPase